MLKGLRQPRREIRDTVKTRYYGHIRAGSTEQGAAQLTADSFGLPIAELDELTGLPDYKRPIQWTLRQIEHVLFYRWLTENRVFFGGAMDGADTYPRLVKP